MKSLPALSVHNPILVNLFMVCMIVGGCWSALTLVREMFPESRPNTVLIMTPYPGASPAEVEKGVSIKIEEQIKNIEGIEHVETNLSEGLSTIVVRLFNEVKDIDRVVTDVKNAIDSIPRSDFPEEAEETVVSRFEPKLPVISVSLYGDLSDEQLKTLGKRMRDDILTLPGVSDVTLSGTRRDEISVEVRPDQLVRYGLSLMDVSDAIYRANMDMPGGRLKTAEANVAVRTLGERDEGVELEGLIVRADATGGLIRLTDVAEVIDGFEDLDLASRIDGKPGVSVIVFKTETQDAIDIAHRVRALVAGKNGDSLKVDWLSRLTGRERELREIYERAALSPYPSIGTLKVHTDLSRFISGRLDLLQRNGFWGLIFVFLSLLVFLNWRVAFWVMIGLLLAVLGTLLAMKAIGISLNLISMFGLIVVLGMLVDDAIIVAENVYTRVERGEEAELAAIKGAEEVTSPVTCAIATTVVAFAPLLFITGMMGDFMRVLPMIVICSLVISLFEALTILPSHLAESFRKAHMRVELRAARGPGWFHGTRRRLENLNRRVFQQGMRNGYEHVLRLATCYRYVTLAGALALLIVSFGLIGGGIVGVVFIQQMDAETLVASVELPVGSPLSRTDAVMKKIESVTAGIPEIATRFTLVGNQVDMGGGAGTSNAHLGQMIIELAPSEERDRSSVFILDEMRQKTGLIPGVNSLALRGEHAGPAGAAIQIEVSGERLDDLIAVTGKVKDRLRGFDGVFDIEDDFDAGQREIRFELLDSGRGLGLTTESLAMQVRGAFYGLEARKVQRDREDVKIMVRYPEVNRQRLSEVQRMRVAVGDGTLVPLSEVARVTEGTSYASIRRKDQRRTVIVKADVDDAVVNSFDVLASLTPDFERWRREYAGVDFALGGQAEERMKSFGSLKNDGVAAILMIFVILAGLFKSYIQPLIVMSAIPFGVIGAVLGHWIMGYPLTMLSGIGLVALTGIVVNDSLILVDFINRKVVEGTDRHEAVIEGGLSRLRAILLTSVTTILGLAPLMLERSFQARFLIPMAISIAFGLAFSTVLTLVVVPCLYLIVADVRTALVRGWRFVWPRNASSSSDSLESRSSTPM